MFLRVLLRYSATKAPTNIPSIDRKAGIFPLTRPLRYPTSYSFTTTSRLPMPLKKANPNGKRKAPESLATDVTKKVKTNGISFSTDPLRAPHPNHEETASAGIVLRKYYPPEMSNTRALAYNNDTLPRPIDELYHALADTREQREKIEVGESVVHWFKNDLRTRDNHSLYLASEKAKEGGVPLICIYIASPQDWEAHLTAPVRVDFILRTLEVLKRDLGSLDIPLYVETVEKRKKIPARIEELMQKWGARHLYANAEYEVDELRREAEMIRGLAEQDRAFDVLADTCVVPPKALVSGSGKQYSVYSPWFRAWIAHVHSDPSILDLYSPPGRNPSKTRAKLGDLFIKEIPTAPSSKSLTEEEKKRFRSLWPAGEQEAEARLKKFCNERISDYQRLRNFPADAATSNLSVHFSSGTLSARSAIRTARDHNTTKKLDGGNQGIQTWISEIAWRDFYKHILCQWPYVCMNKPFKPEYSNIEWEYNDEHFQAWKKGQTGYPIVDAAMRQLGTIGWMHNRLRMVVASFLAKHLLLDWRMGEKYFMEHLIDGDFASNNGGWGFSASTGADPQPYFRIFNPELQSEKFDADGEFIRKWVPELKGIEGKAIHDPYGRGAGVAAKKAGYPPRVVEHKMARERCLARYKAGLGRDTA